MPVRHQGCFISAVKLSCPECRQDISLDDVNVANDLALCRRCSKDFGYAQVLAEKEAPTVDLNRPPAGAWFHRAHRGFEVGATTRSAAALFLVPFMMVWSGFSLGGI